ncbi:MAG: hypothetical protein JWQ13_164 [Ramlibacter sp.]|jgi:hypothetical protein|nr:hypothetical protein [Ramlibacter sp.]
MPTPLMNLKSSPDRWTEVPAPDEAMLILSGFFLPYSMNSATFFAGKFFVTVMTLGTRTMPPTGTMSSRKTKGSLRYSVALIAFAGLTRKIV